MHNECVCISPFISSGVFVSGSDPLPIPKMVCPIPAVRPGGDLQITCFTPTLCTTVELYRDETIVKTSTSMSNSSVFNLSNMEPSKQGQYSCSYTIQGTNMKSPKSKNITITVGKLNYNAISHISLCFTQTV